MRRFGLVVMVVLGLGTTAWADDDAVTPEVPKFQNADFAPLNTAVAALLAGKATVESVFDEAAKVAKRLNEIESGTGGSLQTDAGTPAPLTPPSSDLVKRLFTAELISEGTVLWTAPDREAFAALGTLFGTHADVEFFHAFGQTNPGFGVRVYSQLVTDSTACTKFAPGVIMPLYRDWIRFKHLHPENFPKSTDAEIAGRERIFVADDCACEKSKVVESLLSTFLKEFPASPLASKVKARLEAVKKKKSKIVFECSPA